MKVLHLAKREVLEIAHSPTIVVGLLATGLILGLAAPFNTSAYLTGLQSVMYWMFLVPLTYLVGSVGANLAFDALRRLGGSLIIAVLAGGIAAGICVFLAMMAVNAVVFPGHTECGSCVRALFLNVMIITLIITSALFFTTQHRARNGGQRSGQTEGKTSAEHHAAHPAAATPRLLDRLPVEKRGVLLSLSVSDHYTEVVTTKGSELLLLRLSDAIREADPIPGLQVHRSHWVALDHIVAARKDGQKAIVQLANGRDIPVSRTYVKALKEAGKLPG